MSLEPVYEAEIIVHRPWWLSWLPKRRLAVTGTQEQIVVVASHMGLSDYTIDFHPESVHPPQEGPGQ